MCMLPLAALSAGQPAIEPQAPLGRVAFAQYCFWTGEMKLGQIKGVIRTEAGFFHGHEVTLVDYDPGQISLEQLAQQARRGGVGDRIHLPAGSRFAGTTSIGGVLVGASLDSSYHSAPAGDQKKQIQGTAFGRLDLNPEEATKVNAFVRSDPRRALESLTPAQRENLAAVR